MTVFKDGFGNLFMARCPECDNENSPNAANDGVCDCCGYQAKEDDASEEQVDFEV